ncbi:type II toxin-antitoxin system death-on-curing family toxin [Schlesneria sp. T3-172]|uniref:type II toxin-antitoxin system death-on-curing family toxin n=1 Tax=Schlesneria sphaerica TaxID=3373610 RepID=UPI0037CC2767
MRYLTADEVVELHNLSISEFGGIAGIRDENLLHSAIAMPSSGFGRVEFYPSIELKAASLCFSLIKNHPFTDGNKRVGHMAMETFLILNGYELHASVDESEQLILEVAAGNVGREQLSEWIRTHMIPTIEVTAWV